uniref:Myosin-binding protein C, fast-type n=1 Tax=Zeugodacus cucurbitae TaxID=28588 RepID=A0A0A1XFG4_ZEUCU
MQKSPIYPSAYNSDDVIHMSATECDNYTQQMQQQPMNIQPQQQQQQQPKYEPRAQPALYYNAIAGTPLHTAKMATETKNVMHMKESSETCQRVVNMQQTKRVIHFDSQKEQQERQVSTPLEPFPYSPSPSRYTPTQRVPPPPTPTKFVPGEFRETDYDSEIENAKMRPLWTPQGENGPLRFRHVEPPQMGRACSVPRAYERVLSPMEFDRGPEMPAKIKVDANELRSQRGSSLSAAGTTSSQRTQSLNRHSSMKSSTTSSSYQQRYQTLLPDTTVVEKRFPRDDMNLKVGSPPKYIQSHIDQQGKQMSSTFLQKSHQFISDITSDLQQKSSKTTKIYNGSAEPKVITHSFRPGFKRAPSEGDNKPQAYRDESRVSQYATELPSDVPVNAHLNRDDYPKRAPQFITPLKEHAVMLGQCARFECIVQSHPPSDVIWSRNGVALQNSAKYAIEYRNGVCRLTIPQAYPDDAGVYACTAANPLGTAITSGQLLVQAKRL